MKAALSNATLRRQGLLVRKALENTRSKAYYRQQHYTEKSTIPQSHIRHYEVTTINGESSSFFKRFWNWYTKQLYNNPLRTKTTAAAIIFFTSDSATQYIMSDEKSKSIASMFRTYQNWWDPHRAGSGAAFGVVATAWLHYWWGFLEMAVGSRFPVAQYRLTNTLIKVALDQGIGAVGYIYTYYVLTHFLQNQIGSGATKAIANDEKQQQSSTERYKVALQETHERAMEMLWPTMRQHWKVWPLVHSFNFYYVPLHHRVLVQNTILVGWSGYLSHLNNGGLMTPNEEVEVTIKRQEATASEDKKMEVVTINTEKIRQAALKRRETRQL